MQQKFQQILIFDDDFNIVLQLYYLILIFGDYFKILFHINTISLQILILPLISYWGCVVLLQLKATNFYS